MHPMSDSALQPNLAAELVEKSLIVRVLDLDPQPRT
jgi:hypothetical protein